jgi:hypothetical protein
MKLLKILSVMLCVIVVVSCESMLGKSEDFEQDTKDFGEKYDPNSQQQQQLQQADRDLKESGDALDKFSKELDAQEQKREQAQAEIHHPEFTQDSALKVRQGLTPKRIVAIFGKPDSITTAPAGSKTPKPWTALVYTYHMKKLDVDMWDLSKDNIFYFDMADNLLTSWQINFVN